MICTNCHRRTTSIKTVVDYDRLVSGCEACLHTLIQGNELVAQNKRTYDRREHRKSNIQPVEVREYIEAYPEQAKEIYSEETLRKYGH